MKHIRKFFENNFDEEDIRNIFNILSDNINGNLSITQEDPTSSENFLASAFFSTLEDTYDVIDYKFRDSPIKIAETRAGADVKKILNNFLENESDIFHIKFEQNIDLCGVPISRNKIMDHYLDDILPNIEEINDRLEDTNYYFLWRNLAFASTNGFEKSLKILTYYFLYKKDYGHLLNDLYKKLERDIGHIAIQKNIK